jgi:hypothetical protein
MNSIHIANEKRRDAEVSYAGILSTPLVSMALADGRERCNVKILKSPMHLTEEALTDKYSGLKNLGQEIIDSDPEVDMEITGKKIAQTHRLYLNAENEIAYRVNMVQLVMNPDGTEKERRELNKLESNINGEHLLQWSGKKISKQLAIRKFVFLRKYQLKHISGLTFDFLYDMAKDLHESQSLMMVGAGAKGVNPVIMTGGGVPYHGFLEGRTEANKYCLILHLTNIELKGI